MRNSGIVIINELPRIMQLYEVANPIDALNFRIFQINSSFVAKTHPHDFTSIVNRSTVAAVKQ
jgi:hypothetical protein